MLPPTQAPPPSYCTHTHTHTQTGETKQKKSQTDGARMTSNEKRELRKPWRPLMSFRSLRRRRRRRRWNLATRLAIDRRPGRHQPWQRRIKNPTTHIHTHTHTHRSVPSTMIESPERRTPLRSLNPQSAARPASFRSTNHRPRLASRPRPRRSKLTFFVDDAQIRLTTEIC